MERIDDHYVNEYLGGDIKALWQFDHVDFMVDGDHSGGDYSMSANPDWTEEEKLLNDNREAQRYFATPEAPDGRNVDYAGEARWVGALPYSEGGGLSVEGELTTSIIEFYITPFDDLIWNSPERSHPTELEAERIIGFDITVPDFDAEPRQYHAFHTLSGRGATWRFAERFVDGRLVGGGGAGTAVERDSWGRIKASFAE